MFFSNSFHFSKPGLIKHAALVGVNGVLAFPSLKLLG